MWLLGSKAKTHIFLAHKNGECRSLWSLVDLQLTDQVTSLGWSLS